MSHHTQPYIPKHLRPGAARSTPLPTSPGTLAIAAVASPLPAPQVSPHPAAAVQPASTSPPSTPTLATASSPSSPPTPPAHPAPPSLASSFSIGTTLTLIRLRADGLTALIALADELADSRFDPASRLEALDSLTRLPFIRVPTGPMRDAGPDADSAHAIFSHHAQGLNQKLMAAKCSAANSLAAIAQSSSQSESTAGSTPSPDTSRKAVRIRIKAAVTLCRTPITRFTPQDLGEPRPLPSTTRRTNAAPTPTAALPTQNAAAPTAPPNVPPLPSPASQTQQPAASTREDSALPDSTLLANPTSPTEDSTSTSYFNSAHPADAQSTSRSNQA